MACHTLTPFSLPVSVASEHAENKWHETFLSLLLNQLRACIIYSHLHVTLNSYHDWEHLLNILVPAIGQKSTSRLFHSNLWLWLRLYICVLYFLFNCMLVLFSHFGYNEINIHAYKSSCFRDIGLFSRYWALSILGSRVWPSFRGHLTSSVLFPIGHLLLGYVVQASLTWP